MFLTIKTAACVSGLAAYAGPCYVAPAMDNRPYIGFVNFCPNVSDCYKLNADDVRYHAGF